MPVIGDPSIWAKFGISGLVIFTLFSILIFTILFTIKRFDKIDARNIEAAKNLENSHREERLEWRVSNREQVDKFATEMSRLADSIRDNKNN